MNSPQFFKPDWQVPANVEALITTRNGGVSAAPYLSLNLALHVGDEESAVLRNRQLLAKKLPPALQWQWLEQVHGATTVRIQRAQDDLVADGLITRTPGLACCVLTADCLSVFIAADDGSEVALAHAGWRGLVAGIVANTVRGMSVPAERLLVWLGPAIGPCHFEIGEEVRDALLQQGANYANDKKIASCFQPAANQGKYLADLFALTRLQLQALGVQKISGGGECTVCSPENYYSFRRDGSTGRQLSLIYLNAAA